MKYSIKGITQHKRCHEGKNKQNLKTREVNGVISVTVVQVQNVLSLVHTGFRGKHIDFIIIIVTEFNFVILAVSVQLKPCFYTLYFLSSVRYHASDNQAFRFLTTFWLHRPYIRVKLTESLLSTVLIF